MAINVEFDLTDYGEKKFKAWNWAFGENVMDLRFG